MKNSRTKLRPPKLFTLAVIIAAAVGVRLLIHTAGQPMCLSNFAPIGAMALFGGAYFGKSRFGIGFLTPIAAVLISDCFVNHSYNGSFNPLYEGFYWQYGAYALMVVTAAVLLKRGVRPVALVGTSLVGSITFFAVTNFGVWASGFYGHTVAGLAECYAMGILWEGRSAFAGTILGDLFFSCVLFGAFELAKSKFPSVAAKPVAA